MASNLFGRLSEYINDTDLILSRPGKGKKKEKKFQGNVSEKTKHGQERNKAEYVFIHSKK